MTPIECGNQYINGFGQATYCNRSKGHTGNHEKRTVMGSLLQAWPNPGSVAFSLDDSEELVTVSLTLEELKGLVYALSGPEWLEDEPELVAKIDKALKGAL